MLWGIDANPWQPPGPEEPEIRFRTYTPDGRVILTESLGELVARGVFYQRLIQMGQEEQ